MQCRLWHLIHHNKYTHSTPITATGSKVAAKLSKTSEASVTVRFPLLSSCSSVRFVALVSLVLQGYTQCILVSTTGHLLMSKCGLDETSSETSPLLIFNTMYSIYGSYSSLKVARKNMKTMGNVHVLHSIS